MYENAVARMAEECADEGSVAEKRTEFFSSVDKGVLSITVSVKLPLSTSLPPSSPPLPPPPPLLPLSLLCWVDYGSASLFRRACKAAHWCLLSQEGCLHTSLAALELLQGLAQLQFEYIGELVGEGENGGDSLSP